LHFNAGFIRFEGVLRINHINMSLIRTIEISAELKIAVDDERKEAKLV